MTDLTKFNERLEVPAGGYINIHRNDGGQLLFDGVEFDPNGGGGGGGGGSSTLAALTDVDLTSLKDGDLLVWDAGTSKFVNNGNQQIGALVEVSSVPTTDGVFAVLPLDPANTDYVVGYWMHGLTLNDTGDGYVVATAGRYRIDATIFVQAHATAWLSALIQPGGAGTITANALYGSIVIPPQSVTTVTAPIINFSAVMELAAGYILKFSLKITGSDSLLGDSSLSVQYIGPAVSL